MSLPILLGGKALFPGGQVTQGHRIELTRLASRSTDGGMSIRKKIRTNKYCVDDSGWQIFTNSMIRLTFELV